MCTLKRTAAALIFVSATAVSSVSNAEVSANLGFMSDYVFRGVYQTSSSAYTGIDFEQGGFNIGAWAADVDDGIEYDIYGVYDWEFESGFSIGGAATGYFYTDDWDETYTELTLNSSYKLVSLELTAGNWDGDTDAVTLGKQDADYTFAAITVGNSLYAKYGTFGNDFEGDYFEVGYSRDVGDLSLGVALVVPDDDLDVLGNTITDGDANADVYLTIDIGYSFDL